MAADIGPIVATASLNLSSSFSGIFTNPTSVAPIFSSLNLFSTMGIM